jgi:hypothetical protein
MEQQQPVRRRRRRRRRRSSLIRRETIAWVTYMISLSQRAWRWAGLVLLVALILFLGLGAPLLPVERILSIWGHW